MFNHRVTSHVFLSYLRANAVDFFFPGCSRRRYNHGDRTRSAREERLFAGSLRELPQLGRLQSLLRLRSARGSYLVGTQGTPTLSLRLHRIIFYPQSLTVSAFPPYGCFQFLETFLTCRRSAAKVILHPSLSEK